jgi:hypothetical protein
LTEFVEVEGICGGTAAEGPVKCQTTIKKHLTLILLVIVSNKFSLKVSFK